MFTRNNIGYFAVLWVSSVLVFNLYLYLIDADLTKKKSNLFILFNLVIRVLKTA
jgi:hypothetical protein